MVRAERDIYGMQGISMHASWYSIDQLWLWMEKYSNSDLLKESGIQIPQKCGLATPSCNLPVAVGVMGFWNIRAQLVALSFQKPGETIMVMTGKYGDIAKETQSTRELWRWLSEQGILRDRINGKTTRVLLHTIRGKQEWVSRRKVIAPLSEVIAPVWVKFRMDSGRRNWWVPIATLQSTVEMGAVVYLINFLLLSFFPACMNHGVMEG